MKKLHSTSRIPVGPSEAWELFESEEFRVRMHRETGIRAVLIDQWTEGSITVSRFEFTTDAEVPAVAAKVLGAKHLSYTQINRYDPGASRLDWTVLIPSLGSRLNVGGITTIHPHDGGCKRVVDGTIEIRVRLIGGQLEKFVTARFEASMAQAVDVVRGMIRDRDLG